MISKGMNVGNTTFFGRIRNRLNGIDGAKREIIFVLVVYLASVALHYCLTNFDKTLSVYMDEVLYYDMARSLYNGQGLLVRGLTMDFQKVAYSLLLAPFFSIGDPVLRIKIMSLFNCLLIISSVFPMYLITKGLGLKRKTKYIVIALTAFWPDMLLSCTFMAENLYWPLFLFSIYLFILGQKTNRTRYAIIQGVICYIGYFCKEHFLAVVLTYIALEICYPFVSNLAAPKASRKDLRAVYSEHFTKKRAVNLAVFIVTFAICLVAVKLVFFSDVNSIYYKPDKALASFDFYKLLYLVYAFFYYIAAMLISVFVLPLIYPIFNFGSCDNNSRKLICFSYIYLLIMAAIIAFTISINEDLGKIVPRVHLRYIEPCVLILVVMFFKVIQDSDDNFTNKKRRFSSFVAVGAVSLFACLLYKGSDEDSTVGQFVLHFYNDIRDAVGVYKMESKDTLVIYFGSFVVGAVISLFVLAMHLIFLNPKNSKKLTGIFAVLLMILCIDNGYIHYTQILRMYQTIPAEMIDEVLEMNRYFSDQPEECSVLYVAQGKGNFFRPSRCFDTYFEKKNNVYCIGDKLYKEISSNDSVPVSELKLHEPMWNYEYQPPERIDYVIIAAHLDNSSRVAANSQLVDELRNDAYHVYKNTDTNTIYFEDNKEFAFSGGAKSINFYVNDHNISEYVIKGCSELWQLNDYFRVEIPVIGDYEKLNVTVRVLVSNGLSKSYEICQSNNVIGSGQVSGMSTVSFTGDVENGKLSFDMYMLDIYDDDIDADKQISPEVCLQEITVNQIENF